jgi:hypothetical protein
MPAAKIAVVADVYLKRVKRFEPDPAARPLDNSIKIEIHKKAPCFIFGRLEGLIYLIAKKRKQIVDLCL